MEFKVTALEILANYRNIIAIGYREAEALLRYENPIAYSAGVYGWLCDYYDIDGVCISTGYGPIGKPIDYEKLREAEKTARMILNTPGLDYESAALRVKEVLRALLADLEA